LSIVRVRGAYERWRAKVKVREADTFPAKSPLTAARAALRAL
jgi:hypothetical protein